MPCCKSSTDNLEEAPKSARTKPKWKVIIVVSFAHLLASCSFVFPFSYTPAMITHFGYSDDKRGYYVGLLGTSRFVGSIFGSLIFGFLSDRFGRRRTMLVTLGCQILLNLGFGFSVNFIMAFSIRLVTGLLGGITPICKTIMYEVSDSTNQSVGMSVVNAAYAIGLIFGMFIGGPLAQPIVQYPTVFSNKGLLKIFPFCLPSIVVGTFCLIVFIMNFLCLPETRGARHDIDDDEENVMENTNEEEDIPGNSNMERVFTFTPRRETYFYSLQHIPLKDDSQNDMQRCESESHVYHRHETCAQRKSMSFAEMARIGGSQMAVDGIFHPENNSLKVEKSTETETVKTDGIFMMCWKSDKLKKSIILYSVYGFILMFLEESVILFYTEEPTDGIGFMPKEIAILGGVYSGLMIPAIIILPALERRFGILRIHLFLLLPSLISILFTPYCRFLHENRVALWSGLFIAGLPIRICLLCSITCQNIFINNSVPRSLAGSVNGVATVAGYLLRAAGAAAGPAMFQWSIVANLPYPLDVNLVFQASGILVLLTAAINYKMPLSIEVPIE